MVMIDDRTYHIQWWHQHQSFGGGGKWGAREFFFLGGEQKSSNKCQIWSYFNTLKLFWGSNWRGGEKLGRGKCSHVLCGATTDHNCKVLEL